MKILNLIDGLRASGVASAAVALTDELNSLGIKSTLVTTGSLSEITNSTPKSFEGSLGIIKDVNVAGMLALASILFIRERKKISKILELLSGRVVVAHHFVPILVIALIKRRFGLVVPTIAVIHTDVVGYLQQAGITRSLLFRYAILPAINNADKIVFVSHDAMRRYTQRFTVDVECCVIYNLVKRSRPLAGESALPSKSYRADVVNTVHPSTPVRSGDRVFRVLCVGSFSATKRQDSVVRAFHEFKSQLSISYPSIESELRFLGDGEKLGDVRYLTKLLCITESVRFAGSVDNVREALSASDVVISGSTLEGLPMSLLEAVADNVPLIAVDGGGIREILDPEGRFRDVRLPVRTNIGWLVSQPKRCFNISTLTEVNELQMSMALMDIFVTRNSAEASLPTAEGARRFSKVFAVEAIVNKWLMAINSLYIRQDEN